MSATGEPISFVQHIKPLFRERDRESMMSDFDLWSYDDVARRSDAILARLRDGSMPCDGAWADERIALFHDWVAAGNPPEALARAPEYAQGYGGTRPLYRHGTGR